MGQTLESNLGPHPRLLPFLPSWASRFPDSLGLQAGPSPPPTPRPLLCTSWVGIQSILQLLPQLLPCITHLGYGTSFPSSPRPLLPPHHHHSTEPERFF